MSANVVSLTEVSLFLHHIDALRMIVDIQPVTHILAVAVHRKLLALQRIVDNQRDQLLRKLIRSVIVGTVRDVRRELVGINVCLYQHI